MARTSITATDIAHCGAMNPDRRRRWASDGDLRAAAPFKEHDAVETAVAAELARVTTQQKATIAFKSIRADLREWALKGHFDLWAVIPTAGVDFHILGSAEAAARATAELRGPAWLVPLGEAAEEARRRYARHLASVETADAAVSQLRAAGEDSN